jgi:hypothetical protein
MTQFPKVCFAWLVLGICSSCCFAADDLSDSWAFIHPRDYFSDLALLDLRFLNETTAGESGFIHLSPDGNSFVRGDGKPIRFWACGTGEYQKDDAELASHARFLAKIGVNMVRLHTQIAPQVDAANNNAPPITDVNKKEIDDIWRAVAAFKKEGIYVTISPYWANEKAATKWGIDGYSGTTDLWGLLFFNETLQQGYKAWVRALYEPVNPHTGLPLAKDPAVAIIQVQNEDGMFFWTMQSLKPPQKIELGKKFAQWLKQKYGSLQKASAAWNGFSTRDDRLAQGIVDIMLIWEWTQPQAGGKARRLADQLEFFAATQHKFYSELSRFYRDDLGCKQLINGSNWTTADAVRLGDVERYTNTPADVMAVNRYFDGVHLGKNNGWRIDPGDSFTNKPAVLNPRELPTNLKQVVGHPMIITESSWVNPLDFQSEGPFLIAAYESLTGVAGFYWFDASAAQYDSDPYFDFLNISGQHPFRKWSCSTPPLMGNFPAAALMYRKEYLKQGDTVILEQRPLEDLWQRKIPVIAEDPTFDPNRNTGDAASAANVATRADPLAFLVGPVRVNYGGSADHTPSKISDLSSFIDHQKKIIKSNTGQIQLDYNSGLCKIDSPCAQGASGFLKKAAAIHLHTIDLTCENDHASILVVSMDEKPLSESKKILVQLGTRARPTGWIEEPADFKGSDDAAQYHGFKIQNTGTMPFRIADAKGTLLVHNASLTKATTLDASGYAAKQIPLTRDGNAITLSIPTGTMYVILE